MDKGDIITIIGGFAVILVLAVITNPGTITSALPGTGTPATVQATAIPTIQPYTTKVTPPPTPTAVPTPPLPPQPYRIRYTTNPYSYPVIHIPDHMETYGTSDIPIRENTTIPFAYVNESRGGLTTIFQVPYDVWALNVSVTAQTKPQYAQFQMVLCDAKTGTIITGTEIFNGGNAYKVVRRSGSMYMIVSVSYVDSFQVTLETPYSYYVKAASHG